MAKMKNESGSGHLDYGANNPTGGTKENTGKINPQGPTSGTENYSPDKKGDQQQTTAGSELAGKTAAGDSGSSPKDTASDSPLGDGRNAQDWQKKNQPGPEDALSGARHPNAGDLQTSRGKVNTGSDAHAGIGAGDPGGHFSFRCSDAGNADCRWETSMASADQLWNEIQQHHREVHGKPSIDEATRGKIQDAIHSRRAA